MFFFTTLRRKTAVGGLGDTDNEAVAELRGRFAAALTPAPALTAGDSPPADETESKPKARKATK